MEALWLQVANVFFYIFHTALILFNLFGWIHPATRRWNLLTLLLTFASWGLLGIKYGWGYCVLTDWHYRVLRRLGETDLPNSYIAFLVRSWTGWLPPENLVNTLTLLLTVLALGCSLWVNLRGKRAKPLT